MFTGFITKTLCLRGPMFLPFAKHHRSEILCSLDLASTFITTDIPSHRLAISSVVLCYVIKPDVCCYLIKALISSGLLFAPFYKQQR